MTVTIVVDEITYTKTCKIVVSNQEGGQTPDKSSGFNLVEFFKTLPLPVVIAIIVVAAIVIVVGIIILVKSSKARKYASKKVKKAVKKQTKKKK